MQRPPSLPPTRDRQSWLDSAPAFISFKESESSATTEADMPDAMTEWDGEKRLICYSRLTVVPRYMLLTG